MAEKNTLASFDASSWVHWASVVFLVTTIAASGTLAYLNRSLDAEIRSIEDQTVSYESKIAELKANPGVQAAEILEKSVPEIEKSISGSTVSNYIRELDAIHRNVHIQFSGFSYQSGKISTSVVAERWLTEDDAIRKTIRLIGGYRSGTSTGSFNLSPVSGFSGDREKRGFSIEFSTK